MHDEDERNPMNPALDERMRPCFACWSLASSSHSARLTGTSWSKPTVICVVAIGDGAQANVERAITNIGANMIWDRGGRCESRRCSNRIWRDEDTDAG
jgi:hypothetical protein